MKRRTAAAWCAVAAWPAGPALAQGAGAAPPLPGAMAGWLVTEQEAREWQGAAGYDEPAPLRMRALVPAIEVLQPQATPDLKLKAPFPIAVRFQAREDAAIVPATFRVLYGALRLDITSRITQHVQPTAQGFSFERAQIPAGKHRLILQIDDEKQRRGERELRFEVE